MFILAGLSSIFRWVSSKTGIGIFFTFAMLAGLLAGGFMIYAAVREQGMGDKSEEVSNGWAYGIFTAAIAYGVFVLVRALH